ncbi:histone-lysine N-methyltransferase SETMAR [Diachasma alloeum]|uniref:histone-lysine N-methyltransferase SETMAR n=1 Tax=Diachasma alloeum TaxID=454923 RepID=UPI0007384F96|nr:histone-lysine N-methyltransferase SETMAR [Diachasma alloeum]
MQFLLRWVIDNFVNYGTLQDSRHDLPARISQMEKVTDKVEKHLKNHPTSNSIRKTAAKLEFNRETLRLIIKHFLKLHPHKITSHEFFTQAAIGKQLEFSKVLTQMFEIAEIEANRIIVLDEAYFYLNGNVNKQNYRFWRRENPHSSVAKPLHPTKVTVWAALSIKQIHVEIWDGTITGESYLEMLETKFFPFAKKKGLVKDFYFMQDGATPHRTNDVFAALHKVYGDRVIGLGYPHFARAGMEWPPYSPDLNPCDFFLWGYLKNFCSADHPQAKEALISASQKGVSNISQAKIEEVFHSFQKRLDYSDGEHFKSIYH